MQVMGVTNMWRINIGLPTLYARIDDHFALLKSGQDSDMRSLTVSVTEPRTYTPQIAW